MHTPDALDVESADGTRVRVWRTVPEGATEAVLFVHGAANGLCPRGLLLAG